MTTHSDSLPMRRLGAADAAAAAEVLASAFYRDPLWCFLLPEPTRRAALVRQAFRAFVPGAIAGSLAVGVGAPLAGVALWGLPDQPQPRPEALLNLSLVTLVFSPLLATLPRAAPIFSRFEAMRRRYAPEPHYYLSVVGVAPAAQGRGLASALIRPLLAQADARGLTAYTETMTPENVPIHERYGFVVREEVALADADLRLWALQRPRLADTRPQQPQPRSKRQVK